jgi:hypothetical protein
MATITGLFPDSMQADAAVRGLTAAGFDAQNVQVMARDTSVKDFALQPAGVTADALAGGAGNGAIVGGLGGFLVGLGLLAIPGIGPVLATGALATALASTAAGAVAGAAAGSVIVALVGFGVAEEDAPAYAEGIKRGGVLVAVSGADNRAGEARSILNANGAVDISNKRNEWSTAGWKSFDPATVPDERYPRF